MVEQTVQPAPAETAEGECAHHWQIETPAGETSLGVCKLCGATRAFANYSQRRTMTRTVKPPIRSSGG